MTRTAAPLRRANAIAVAGLPALSRVPLRSSAASGNRTTRRAAPGRRKRWLRIPVLSTLSGGIRTYGPVRARPEDQPLARRGTSQRDDHVVGKRGGRSVAPNGDSLGRGAEELRPPPSRLRPAGRNRHPRFAPLRPLAEGTAHVVGAGLRACGEVPRPLVGGLGDRPPRPRERDGEAHGRDDADGRAVEPAPARDVAREAVTQARLACRPDPEDRGLAPRITRRRGAVGAAGRADLRAADRFEGRVGPIWKQLHRQYPSVEAEAHAVLDVGGGELLARRLRRPFDVGLACDGHHDRDEGDDEGGARRDPRQGGAPEQMRVAPGREASARTAPLVAVHRLDEVGVQAADEVLAHLPFLSRPRSDARPRLTRMRSAVSEVPSSDAISGYGRSSSTRAWIAVR